MSGRSRRDINKLDYKVLHLTGDKVSKSRDPVILKASGMDQIETIKMEEKLLIAEINDMIDISELLDEYEVDSYKEDLKAFRKKLREIHIRIQMKLGEDQHKELFPDIENYLEQLKRKEIEASTKKRSLFESKEYKTKKDDSEKCIKVLLFNILEFCKDNLEDVCNLGVIERIMRAERYIEYLNKTRVECECALGTVNYEDVYAEKCEKVLYELRRHLSQCKKLNKELDEEIKEKGKNMVVIQNEDIRSEIQNRSKNEKEIEIAMYLFKLVLDMGAKLIKELSVTVSGLEDIEILDKKRNVSTLDSKIDRLLAKSIEFRRIMPDNYENKDADWLKVTNLIDYVNQLSDEYNSALNEEMLTRGINKHKLCNESNLKINLPKFRGYDSPLDIYSFQAEFEKLISPTVKVNLIPDYLKNNFLEGTALLVVKDIDNLEDIWQRLKNAYGNTENLLKIKLKDIRKDGPIWKIKDPERFVKSLSKLIYALLELQKLAFKHNIENELYYGGSIETIYEIIGFKYRNKFIEKYCQTKLSKKEIWDKMIHYLKDKLVVMEQIVLIDQSKSTYNPKMKLEEEKHYKVDSKMLYHSFGDSDKELKCHLCDRSDHVSTLDFRGKNVIEYYACEKFVNMTPKQRFELLKEKGLCRQCLNPGVRENSGSHKECKCYSRFTCKNKHDGSRKWHVLVCYSHKHEKNNLIFLDEYKRINMSKDKLVLPEYK